MKQTACDHFAHTINVMRPKKKKSIAQIYMWIWSLCINYDANAIDILSLDYFHYNFDYFLKYVYLNSPCQLSLHVGRGENRSTWRKPMTLGRALTDSFNMSRQRENRTHYLRGERRWLWRLQHQSLIYAMQCIM